MSSSPLSSSSPNRISSSSSSSSSIPLTLSPSLDPVTSDNSIFFVCDIQETFRGKIINYDHLIAASVFLCRAAKELNIPILTTEQRPFKPTVKELQALVTGGEDSPNKIFGKSLFSMLTSEVLAELSSPSLVARRHIVLFGIEAHVCVLQTALDLLRQGYQVHLVIDGVSSQTNMDREVALERLKSEGARASSSSSSLVFTTAESVLYEIVKDAHHPAFKALVPAIKEYSAAKKALAPPTGAQSAKL